MGVEVFFFFWGGGGGGGGGLGVLGFRGFGEPFEGSRVGMFPVLLTVLNRDSSNPPPPFRNPNEGL